MRHYEITFLVHPDQGEQVPAMIERYRNVVISGQGQVHRVENWGRRRLAYIINDVHKAHYVMLNIECDLKVLGEIENNFKFNDFILRHLVIRRKAAVTEESPIAREKAREDVVEAEKVAKLTSAVDGDDTLDKDVAKLAENDLAKLPPDEVALDDSVLDDSVLDDAVLDEYALEEDSLEEESIKDAALKNGGIV